MTTVMLIAALSWQCPPCLQQFYVNQGPKMHSLKSSYSKYFTLKGHSAFSLLIVRTWWVSLYTSTLAFRHPRCALCEVVSRSLTDSFMIHLVLQWFGLLSIERNVIIDRTDPVGTFAVLVSASANWILWGQNVTLIYCFTRFMTIASL
jgi:hypothetical protein